MSELNDLMDAAEGIVSRRQELTSEFIEKTVRQLSTAYACVSDDNIKQIITELESRHIVTVDDPFVIQAQHTPWLDTRKLDIDPYYWTRYSNELRRNGFSNSVIAKLDDVTDRTLDRLNDPHMEGAWYRRGMVVGHVQSGKTANYTGLVCKAADAGYRVIIIIAGIHNNLRSQTQVRIDEGFIGSDSSATLTNNQRLVGVGTLDLRSLRFPVSLTSRDSDFKKRFATQAGLNLNQLNEPVVFVIKKNVSTLNSLIDWLKTHNTLAGERISTHPMLLIDDEADNASIDTNKDPENPTRINELIRRLLHLFDKKGYVGYTATPFANIFIHPENKLDDIGENLFPKDFIISLEPPSNYVGASRIFGEDADMNLLREVDDYADILPLRHKNYHPVEMLPNSLTQAIRVYLLARATRILRGHGTRHSSMLVNVSRFVSVQEEIHGLIHAELEVISDHIRVNGGRSADSAVRNSSEISELRDIWGEEFGDSEFTWIDVFSALQQAISPIKVIQVNQRHRNELNYNQQSDQGIHAICVGGLSLSRGLTLEGLLVSYFLRNSQMYDTLMQMGRWFGYRPGYEDLCRIYMTDAAIEWYSHISNATDELRSELRRMEIANLTPSEFGLRVRTHPDSLIVTAKNKMRTARTVTCEIDLNGKLIESATLDGRAKALNANRELLEQTVTRLLEEKGDPVRTASGNYIWNETDVRLVAEFSRLFQNHESNPTTDSGPLQDYMGQLSQKGIDKWDVVLVSKKSAETDGSPTVAGLSVGPQLRTSSRDGLNDCLRVTSRGRVASRGLEKEGLSTSLIVELETEWKDKKGSTNIPDRVYREARSRPLLMLHLLDMRVNGTPVAVDGVVAYGISFPRIDGDMKTVEYMVNTTYWYNLIEDDEDEEDD